jgi:putative transposase
MGRRKTHTPEEIVAKLRQVEVLAAQGKPVAEAVRTIGVTEATYYRWRVEYGGLKLDQVRRLKGSGHCPERAGERAAAQGGVGLGAREGHPEGGRFGKILSPARRRACAEHVERRLGVSERRACAVLGQHRSTQRKTPRTPDDEAALTADVVELAKRYGRYGYTGASPRCCGTPGGP